jgi:hypothetical protein
MEATMAEQAKGAAIEVRTYCFLDAMQRQFASFIATVARGYLPVAGQAALFLEISPGLEINRLLDVALKTTNVAPGLLVVEREFGVFEIHAEDQGAVRRAGEAVLMACGLKQEQCRPPRIVSSTIIRNVTDYQTMLINRMRHGQMLLGGQTLYVLETEPAGYTALAANEAEKASHVNLLEVLTIGRYGRLYLGGEEADVVVAAEAAERSLQQLAVRMK